MTEKKTNIKEVDKLRDILLVETDLKFVKILVGVLMKRVTEKAGEITPYPYGSRKGHISIEAGLNKDILFSLRGMIIWAAGIVLENEHT